MITPTIAARVWVEDETLYLELPSPVPGARSSVVALTCSPSGFAKAILILRNRGPKATLGTVGAPTQWLLDKSDALVLEWLSHNKPKRREQVAPAGARDVVRDILKKRGMI